jgi:hypothetical protein
MRCAVNGHIPFRTTWPKCIVEVCHAVIDNDPRLGEHSKLNAGDGLHWRLSDDAVDRQRRRRAAVTSSCRAEQEAAVARRKEGTGMCCYADRSGA